MVLKKYQEKKSLSNRYNINKRIDTHAVTVGVARGAAAHSQARQAAAVVVGGGGGGAWVAGYDGRDRDGYAAMQGRRYIKASKHAA